MATILQGKDKHCTIGVFFVMFVIKSGGTMRDGENHMWLGSRAHLRALEALALFYFKHAFSCFSKYLIKCFLNRKKSCEYLDERPS